MTVIEKLTLFTRELRTSGGHFLAERMDEALAEVTRLTADNDRLAMALATEQASNAISAQRAHKLGPLASTEFSDDEIAAMQQAFSSALTGGVEAALCAAMRTLISRRLQ